MSNDSSKLVFKQGRVTEIFSTSVLVIALIVITSSVVYAGTLSIDKLLTAVFIALGIYVSIIFAFVKRLKHKNYFFEIDTNNVLKEHENGKIVNEIAFSKIYGVKNLASKTDEPVVVIYGKDINNSDIEFKPTYTPNLTRMFLKLKDKYPEITIDANFSRHVEIFKHKKIFGAYDPYLMFLFITLLIGILWLPVLLIYEFLTGKF